MTLNAMRNYTDGEAHPYIKQASQFLLDGSETYCVLKAAACKNSLYTAMITAVVNRIAGIACLSLEKGLSDYPIVGTLSSSAFSFFVFPKLSKPVLARLGVQEYSLKIRIAICIINEIFLRLFCPSQSMTLNAYASFQKAQAEKEAQEAQEEEVSSTVTPEDKVVIADLAIDTEQKESEID